MMQDSQFLSFLSRKKEFIGKAEAWKERQIARQERFAALREKNHIFLAKKEAFNAISESEKFKKFVEDNLDEKMKSASDENKSEREQLNDEAERIQEEINEEDNKITQATRRGVSANRIAPHMKRLQGLMTESEKLASKLKKNKEKKDKYMKEYDSAVAQLVETFRMKIRTEKEVLQAEEAQIQFENEKISAEKKQSQLDGKVLAAERDQINAEAEQLKASGAELKLMDETEKIKVQTNSSDKAIAYDFLDVTPSFLNQSANQKRTTQLRQSGISLNEMKTFLSDSKNIERMNQGLEKKFVGIDKALRNATGNHIEIELEGNGVKGSVHLQVETHLGKNVISYSVDRALRDDLESIKSLCRLAVFSAETENKAVSFTVNESHPHKDKMKEYFQSALQEVASRNPEAASRISLNGAAYEPLLQRSAAKPG